ncbi:MAG: NAD(P)-binding protein [Kiritimatiellia bacterium]
MKNTNLIIGAGVSGLTAARILASRKMDVQLVDKGRGVGGRVATRRLGERDAVRGRWDHGAQFATFRSTSLMAQLRAWGCLDCMSSWLPGHNDPELDRRRPLAGMNAFAKALAGDLPVHRSQQIVRLEKQEPGWIAHSSQGEPFHAARLISTLPVPQFLDLVRASSLELEPAERRILEQVRYERTLTLLAELDGPSGLEENGYVRVHSGILETLIDQQQKGISAAPALVAHAAPAFSLEWYERDRATAASVLRAAVQEKIQSHILNTQIHGWKFSKAIDRVPRPFLELSNGLLLAGDGFCAGDETAAPDLPPRIESAMLSGRAAALHLAGGFSHHR